MMKKLMTYLFVIIFALSITGFMQPGYAQKSKQAIKELLQKRYRQIKDILGPEGTEYSQKQRQKLKDVINDVIDYRAMSKYALQDTWDNISSQQQNEFVHLFSTIVRDHSLQNLDIYRAKVSYLNISLNDDSALVKTLATRKDIRKKVNYKLYYKEEKEKWVVTDFSINDVSTADSYRRQFQNIIRKNGFEKLMDILRKRAKQ
jgi:phospholipid transport system substrate-binding protein